jgi:hypothetical protein
VHAEGVVFAVLPTASRGALVEVGDDDGYGMPWTRNKER